MKKYIVLLFLFFAVFSALTAQLKRIPLPSNVGTKTDSARVEIDKMSASARTIDTTKIQVPNIYVWKITPRLGERVFVPRDSAVLDFHQSMLVDGKGVAIGYLGNIGSPAQSKVFFERPETSRFIFMDAMRFWRKNPEDQYFYNTKVPYSEVKYQSGGGGQSAENRFQAELTMNMGKKLNVGFDFDYIYSRGFYTSLSNKEVSYDFYASYIGDKYKMHAFFHNNNLTNIENGGIKDTLYITNPDDPSITNSNFKGNSLDIPTRVKDTWNRLRGRHLYVTNRYDLGDDSEEYQVNDSVVGVRKKKNYIPLASAILTTHYTDQRRRVSTIFSGMDDIYPSMLWNNDNSEWVNLNNSNKYIADMNDYMSYYSFKNTLALAMNEGFRKWTKFGLTAFAEYDMRKYSMPVFQVNEGSVSGIPGFSERVSENALLIGGVLSKEKGRYLRYRATVEKDLLNSDYRLEGEISTMLNIKNKDFAVRGRAYIKNISPSFFQNNFSSKYWNWKRDFDDTHRFYIGGEIDFPELSFSKTKVSGGVENIKGYIYYGENGLPTQKSGDVQVISLRLDQNFEAGILHWDNQVVFQHSEDQVAIPLPKLSIYTNIYLTTKLAKVLTLQLGADAHYHSKYYMPGYDFLTMQFYNQRDMELGNFPITSAYLNLHLKYTRFFVMMYNLTNGMGNSESFSLYRYPVNPRVLKLGISWRFNN
ncbi:MAG: putative porin [Prevotella sp.]|jgi:hypothetical protein|nr:putative porin [Prevotella sp.]